MSQPTAVFVYGTLKRGQMRERCWPRKALGIEAASLRGALYDLGPYPGLAEGEDTIAGELWHFAAGDMPATLAALDKIEGVRGRADDEYHRVILSCQSAGRVVSAWAYRCARLNELTPQRRIQPDGDGVCRWPPARDQRSEVGDQRSEVGDQRSEVGDQRSEIRGRRSEVRGRKSEIRGRRSEVGDQ